MPGATPLGIRYPLTSEAPAGAPQMQTLATDVDLLLRPPRARAYVGAAPARASGWTVVGGYVQGWSAGGTVVAADRITVPLAGIYRILAQIQFTGAASGFGVRRGLQVRKNSNNDVAQGNSIFQAFTNQAAAAVQNTVTIAHEVSLAANDYLQLFSYHDATVSVSLTTGADNSSWSVEYFAPAS